LDLLDARITRINYHKPNKFNPSGMPFLIAQTDSGATVKGEMAQPVEGESYRFWGEWKAQNGYPQPAFVFVSHEVLFDRSAAGVAQYLAKYVPGLGPVKSEALVEAFGDETLTILRAEPEKALEIQGIHEAVVASIRKHFEENIQYDPVAYARLIDLFADHRVPKKVIHLLLRHFKSEAPDRILAKPYTLLGYPRMGWKTVDSWATAVAKYDRNGIDRHKWAIVEALERISDDGHTWAARIDIEEICYKQLINCLPRAEAWEAAIDESLIVAEIDHESRATYALPDLDRAEREIADCLVSLMNAAAPLEFSVDTTGLNEEQTQAGRQAESNGVSIVTGPPGTGKSFATAKILSSFVSNGARSIRVTAPTGKAAKRVAELLAKQLPDGAVIPCTTIHKALGPTPSDSEQGIPSKDAKVGRGRDEFTFSKNAQNPIETCHIVIDEASMVDVKLAAKLLRAIKPGTRVIFVGDENQLPSIGPGSFLRDMIEAGIPATALSRIVRSDGGGRVVRACHAIMRGEVPEPAAKVMLPTENWIHVEVDDPTAIAQTIVEMHEAVKRNENSRFDPVWGMQAVSPQNGKSPMGCDHLNRKLSEVLNDWRRHNDKPVQADEPGFDPPFVIGDKVVRTKNGLCQQMIRDNQPRASSDPASKGSGNQASDTNITDELDFDEDLRFTTAPSDEEVPTWIWENTRYKLIETDIVNGDMGEVIDIVPGDKGDSYVVVRFRTPDRWCRLPFSKHHLVSAYALTCHKAQGSGFPYVIVPVHESFWWDHKTGQGLFSREWLYTAISRAEELLVTVGQFSAIRKAVGRKTVHRRRTRLVQRIREAKKAAQPIGASR